MAYQTLQPNKFKNQLISLSPRNGKAVSEMFKLIVKFHNNKNETRDELAFDFIN